MARLDVEHRSFFKETDRLLDLLVSMSQLSATHRKIIAEITHLRLVFLVENHLKRIFSKLCCGAPYLDTSSPQLLARQRSATAAIQAMQQLNRAKAINLAWNDGPSIRRNVEHIVNLSDHSISIVKNNGSFLTELRYIRNHIAHRNDGTLRNFQKIVKNYYGATVPSISSGLLLLSPRVSVPPLIEVHVKTSRILIKDIVKA
jgi:hypothetical protein